MFTNNRAEPVHAAAGADVHHWLISELFWNSRDVVILSNRDGRIIDANRLAERVYGYTRQELCALSLEHLDVGQGHESLKANLLRAYTEGVLYETRHICKDGRTIPVEVNAYKVGLGDREVLIHNIRDIGQRQLTAVQGRGRDRFFLEKENILGILDSIGDGVIITDLEERVKYLNPVAEQLTGWSAAEANGKNLAEVFKTVDEATYAPAPDPVGKCLIEEQLEKVPDHTLLIRRNGSSLAIEGSAAPIRDHRGHVIGAVLVVHDVTEKRQLFKDLAFQAHYDALTSLPNRTLFKERLSQALAQARRRGHKVGIMFIDLDRFKMVNDTYGHGAGDILLQEIASRLTDVLREEDTIARQGGDEFLILIPNVDSRENVAAVARRLLESFRRPFAVYQQEIVITPSIGISIYPDDGEDIDTLIERADLAMYMAKDRGKQNYQFFNFQIGKRVSERLAMEVELRQALAREEFVLHYQPKYSLRSQKITGIEALIRWQSPTRGQLLPAQFIPIAEKSGQIISIGEWVVRTVCRDLKRLTQEGLPVVPVAINISTAQFRDREFMERLLDIIRREQIDPSWVVLEITEAVAMDNTAHTLQMLGILRKQGMRIALDDFGIGSSSLNYLRRLPIDDLKIDQAFIADIEKSRQGAAMVNAIIHSAHCLDLNVIAEGVETNRQLDFLKDKHCDEIQGYYFAKPMPWENMLALLRNNR